MADASHDQRDFFVSFNKADRAWAEWIAWILEEAGHSVLFQHWDFKGNFVLEMDRAHRQTRRTIAVLSPDYLTSAFTAPEWAARFAEDARSEHDLLIPVRVRECELSGRLAQIVYVDLIGTSRSQACQSLLDRVAGIRLKPKEEPFFPGGPLPQAARSFKTEPSFPIALNNLPPANPDFVGREGVLTELRRLLAAGQGPAVLTQAITGLGGIGKTQTARAYAYRHLADYELIWWLRAETPATLAADYTALAAPFGLDPATADQAQLTADIKWRLQSRSSWLLIFDNVEDPALPLEWLPGTGGGHALITSRRTDWRDVAKVLSLELMPEGEALQLLTGKQDPQVLEPKEIAAAKLLAIDLGHLPLALAQARAYMAATGRSLANYLDLFRGSPPSNFPIDPPSPDYPASYATTWRLSIEDANRGSAARLLLEVLAFLAPDPLPIEALGANRDALPEDLRDEYDRDRALAALRRYSLIAVEAGQVTIHRLVQAVARDNLCPETTKDRAKSALRLVAASIPFYADYPSEWPRVRLLLPHAMFTSEWAEKLQTDLPIAAKNLNQVAIYHHARAAWAETEPLLHRAIAIGEKDLSVDETDLAEWLNNLANLYQETHRYAEAETLLQRSIAIYERARDRDHPHPDLITSINNLANLFRATKRYAEAEPLFQRAIAIGEDIHDSDHPDLATLLNNLATLYRDTDRYVEAEPLYQRAITILKASLPPEHPNFAACLSNLALVYQHTGRHAQAEPLFERAIAILEVSLPPDHPLSAKIRGNYAALLAERGHFSDSTRPPD